MYSNISQILLIYKSGGIYNKFDIRNHGVICRWCVKITQCRYMGHGLKLMFYVQKHITALEMCHNQPLVYDKPLGWGRRGGGLDPLPLPGVQTPYLCPIFPSLPLPSVFPFFWVPPPKIQIFCLRPPPIWPPPPAHFSSKDPLPHSPSPRPPCPPPR